MNADKHNLWRFHTFMYTVPSNIHSGSKPQETCSNKALSHRVRNTAMWKWLCLFRVDYSAVCISMYSIQACQLILFNNGPQQQDFYFCSVHSKETVGLIGKIWPNWVNSVLWCYNAAKWWCPSLHISQLIARIISNDFILTVVKLHYISSMHIHSTLAQRHIRFLLCY